MAPLLQVNEYVADESHATCDDVCTVAWVAGLLEGEGSFTLSRDSANSYPVVSLEMVDRDVIERAARVLGAARIQRVEPDRPEWSVTYRAAVAGKLAAEWMRKLRPLMGHRRRLAIDAALAAYQPIRLVDPPRTCVVPGCSAPHRGRGLCHKHYMTWSRDRLTGRSPRVMPLR